MEVKGWIASSWVAASFVTLAGLAIGALVCPKPPAPGLASVGFAIPQIPDCTYQPDSARGDIAVPQTADPNASLSRDLCFGDTLFWHDAQGRGLSVKFTQTGCTAADCTTSACTSSTSGSLSEPSAPAPTTSVPHVFVQCTYTLTATDTTPPHSSHDFPLAHIIIVK
jgi:hypothetical protein